MRIAERAAERLDRCVHAVLEIDEGVGRPEAALQFFSSEQLAGMFKKQRENLEGAAGETDFSAVFAELSGTEINLVGIEPEIIFRASFVAHGRSWEGGVYSRDGRNSSLDGAQLCKCFNGNPLRLYLLFTNKGLAVH